MSKKSKKAKKSKKYEAYNEEQENAAMGITAIILLAVMIVGSVGFYLWQIHCDSKIQANVQTSVTDLQGWAKLYPNRDVPLKTVTGIGGGHQFLNSDYASNDHNENTPHSVHVIADDGNTIAVIPGHSIGSYKICGFSKSSKQFSSEASAVVYDSATGETKTGVPCPITVTPQSLFPTR